MDIKGHVKNIIVVHNGALGDFLCTWPAILAIARYYTEVLQIKNLWFAGRSSWMHWLHPLGFRQAPSEVLQAVERLYTASEWPYDLEHCKVFWFCIQSPVASLKHHDLISLPLLDFRFLKFLDNKYSNSYLTSFFKELPKVMLNLAAQLTALGSSNFDGIKQYDLSIDSKKDRFSSCLDVESGIPWVTDWQHVWQDLFGCWKGEFSNEIALLPGAGHTAKQWPLTCFELLASELSKFGFSPVFILGPAEIERGMLPGRNFLNNLGKEAFFALDVLCEYPRMAFDGSGEQQDICQFNVESPSPPAELAKRLMEMRCIIACDAGPAHLASMHGIPGLVLFGPTRHDIWGPVGLKKILPPLEKTAGFAKPVNDPKIIDNSLPSPITLISPQQVLAAFWSLIEGKN